MFYNTDPNQIHIAKVTKAANVRGVLDGLMLSLNVLPADQAVRAFIPRGSLIGSVIYTLPLAASVLNGRKVAVQFSEKPHNIDDMGVPLLAFQQFHVIDNTSERRFLELNYGMSLEAFESDGSTFPTEHAAVLRRVLNHGMSAEALESYGFTFPNTRYTAVLREVHRLTDDDKDAADISRTLDTADLLFDPPTEPQGTHVTESFTARCNHIPDYFGEFAPETLIGRPFRIILGKFSELDRSTRNLMELTIA